MNQKKIIYVNKYIGDTMKKIIISTIAYFFISNIFACDYFNNRIDNNSHFYMGKKSKIYDAYKQGKCILDDVLKPLTEEQRKVIANLIAKSYTLEN